jgi:hypothetical protein
MMSMLLLSLWLELRAAWRRWIDSLLPADDEEPFELKRRR